MKTALDLPDDLIREIKIEAARRGRKLKDLIAELLRIGLNAPTTLQTPFATLTVDPLTGLPVVAGTRRARPGDEMTAARISEILLQDECEREIDASR